MESGWEVNIARLIDKANETLAASAQSRPYDYVHINRRGWSGRNHGGASSSSSMGVSFASTSAPTPLQGDRSASYRYESEGWDRSSRGNRSQVPLPRSDGVSSNQPLALRSPSFSEPVEARMNDERINGMENRIKLEVQAVIQKDVGQRASLAERATENLRKRVDGLAEEVSLLRNTVLELKTGSQSQRETLEKMQADGEYIKASLDASKKWREDRNAWFTRVDDSLSSLAEEARNLALRTNNQQTILDKDMATREDLAAAAKTAREATELAIASALAPVRENFLQEIGAVRRRLSVVEEDAKRPVVPPLTRVQVQSIAREMASAEGQELWRKVETHMQEKVSGQDRDTGIIDDDFITTFQRVETRLTEVEQHVGKPQFRPETQETRGASTEEVSQLRDTVSALQQRLEETLLGMAETRQGSDQGAENEESKCPSGNLVAAQDLDARIKRLEELEREHIPASLDASTASSAWVDNKVEEMDKRLLELISDAALTAKRQITAEGRLEEVSEQLCGHSLKLRCLDGLWRESGCPGHDKLEAEGFECGENSKEGISSALNRSAKTRRKVPSRKNISSGITKLLKRFGTNNSSTGSNQGHDEVNAEVNHRVADHAQTQTMTVSKPGDAETAIRPRSVLQDGSDVVEDASRVDETIGSMGCVEGSGEIDVDHEALEKDPVSLNNTVEVSQFGKIGSQGLGAAYKDKSTPNGNQPYDGDGDAVNTSMGCRGIHEDQRAHPVGSDPTQGASEPEAIGACKRDRHGEGSKQPRQGEDRGAVANSEVPLDSLPSEAPPASTIKVSVASEGDRGRDAREGGSEDSEGSVHSRWSLPDTGLRDPRRLLEQRAIWVGSRDEEDSVGTLDQALSSECEELRSDGRSSRSRVESYDLPRDVGDGYTLPFLSGVGSAEGELPTSEIETLSGSQGTRTRKTSEDSESLGYDVESGRALSPNSAARVASPKEPASPVGDGRASSPAFASVKDFSCSGGEDESPTGHRSTTSLRENTETKTRREKGGDGRGDEKEEPVRGFCLYDHDYFDEVGGDTEKMPKRRLKGDMTLLDRFPGLRNRDGGEGGGIDTLLDYPRPDHGTRTAPDFGFSSEEDEDGSDLNLSRSDISSLREAEDTGEDVTPRRPQSSSPPPKSISGFDSSSNDLS